MDEQYMDITPKMNAEEYLGIIEADVARKRIGDDTGYLEDMLCDLHKQIVNRGCEETHWFLLTRIREARERLRRKPARKGGR